MLYRTKNQGLFVISQPAHSWVSGQLARAWGNEPVGPIEPAEPVLLAAALHDVGFLSWEREPTLNLETGWPHTFMNLPTDLHLKIWAKGIQELTQVNRYATLLVSLHYTGLTERHPASGSPAEQELQQEFLREQQAFQAELLAGLQKDSYYAEFCHPSCLERNRRLIAVWDWMSLLLGMGFEGDAVKIQNIPGVKGDLTLTLSRQASQPGQLRVSPWPFRERVVPIHFEGRLLSKQFRDEVRMRQELRALPAETLALQLIP